MPPQFEFALTDFGNIAVALPVLAVAVIWLWRHRLRGVAIAVVINVALAITVTTLLKLVSRQSGGFFFGEPWHLTKGAPSGHAAVSMVVYGGIGVLFALRGRGVARILGVALSLGLIACVDVTRITLGFHSPGDVATGLTLGAAFVTLTTLVARASPSSWPSMRLLLLALVVVATVAHLTGIRFDSYAVL